MGVSMEQLALLLHPLILLMTKHEHYVEQQRAKQQRLQARQILAWERQQSGEQFIEVATLDFDDPDADDYDDDELEDEIDMAPGYHYEPLCVVEEATPHMIHLIQSMVGF